MTSWDLMEKLQMNRNVSENYKNNLAAAAELIGQDEEPLLGMFFGQINRGTSDTLFDGALLVTTSRIIVCGRIAAWFSRSPSVGTIAIENVSSVNPNKGIILGDIVIKTIGNDVIRLENIPKNELNDNVAKICEAIEKAKSYRKNATSSVYVEKSPADEIKKYKELLDSGIITQEEFDAKKKQLLGV